MSECGKLEGALPSNQKLIVRLLNVNYLKKFVAAIKLLKIKLFITHKFNSWVSLNCDYESLLQFGFSVNSAACYMWQFHLFTQELNV